MLFHPDHIVPPVEFIAALGKPSDHPVTKMGVKMDAVQRQEFIFRLRIGDAGIQIQDALFPQYVFQSLIQFPPNTRSFAVRMHVNRSLDRPVIGFPIVKCAA